MILHDAIGRVLCGRFTRCLGSPSIQSLRDRIRAERNETKLFFLNTRPGTKKKKKSNFGRLLERDRHQQRNGKKEKKKKTCEKTNTSHPVDLEWTARG